MNHSEMFRLLRGPAGQRFIEGFLCLQHPWSPVRRIPPNKYAYSVYKEFPIIRPWEDEGPPPSKLRPDALIQLSFPIAPFGVFDDCRIIVEFKDTERDLRKLDTEKYRGLAEYIFLAVPADLLRNGAMAKIKESDHWGIFEIETGSIEKMSRREEITASCRLTTFNTMLTLYHHRNWSSTMPRTGYIGQRLLNLPPSPVRFKLVNFPNSPEGKREYEYQRIAFNFRRVVMSMLDCRSRTAEERMALFRIIVDTFYAHARKMEKGDFEYFEDYFPRITDDDMLEKYIEAIL